jgi:hypothetical protein
VDECKPLLYGRHFDHTDELVSRMTRPSIEMLKVRRRAAASRLPRHSPRFANQVPPFTRLETTARVHRSSRL